MCNRNPSLLAACLCVLIAGCHAVGPSPDGRTWVRTELYFGLSRPGGADITEMDFEQFVEAEISSRFPDGYTVVPTQGRWREQGRTRAEASRIVIIYHPAAADHDRLIEQIRGLYKSKFAQDSVLRTDTVQRVSF